MREFVILTGPATGTLITEAMGIDLERGYISVELYDDGSFSNIVTPTNGTITFTGSVDGTSFASINNGVVSAIRTGAAGTYSWPSFVGPVSFVKATFASITGATHAKIFITKYGER